MKALYETTAAAPRALLVGVHHNSTPEECASLARELAGLAATAGLEVAGEVLVKLRDHGRATYGVGTGKADELAQKAVELGADCIVFDGILSPSQQRNWETLTGISVIDRQELIIHIFAERAQTREAELQVTVAELSYSLPRLRHKYLDLSRQRGGSYGSKGSGETRFETDRRLVEQRIMVLREELATVRKNRDTQRKKRERQTVPICALAGYTNAGKSSLLNALTGADAIVENKLFATLDPTARQLKLAQGMTVLLVDTVGFIRNLPHALVDAFHATLEEVALADLIIHVLDASDPDIDRYFETTCKSLDELGAGATVRVIALNKIDRLDPESASALYQRYAGRGAACVGTSATVPSGLDELRATVEALLSGALCRFRFPPDRHDLVALLHRNGTVISESYDDTGITIEARISAQYTGALREYFITEEAAAVDTPALVLKDDASKTDANAR